MQNYFNMTPQLITFPTRYSFFAQSNRKQDFNSTAILTSYWAELFLSSSRIKKEKRRWARQVPSQLSVSLSVCLPVCVSVWLVLMCVYLSMCLSIRLSICLFWVSPSLCIFLFVRLSAFLSVWLYVLTVCHSIDRTTGLGVCLSVCPPRSSVSLGTFQQQLTRRIFSLRNSVLLHVALTLLPQWLTHTDDITPSLMSLLNWLTHTTC